MTSFVDSTKNNSLSSSLSKLLPEQIDSSNSNAPSQALDMSMSSTGSSITNFFANITWQTWLIVILVLALLGINIFTYLAKFTTGFSNIIDTYFGPILKLLGFGVLETTKKAVEVTATGTKMGIDLVENTTVGAIDTIENAAKGNGTMPSISGNASGSSGTIAATGTNTTSNATAQKASSSQKNSMPVQQQIQEAGSVYEWNQGSLDSALNDASKQPEPMPSESTNYTTGKAGWCFIGEDRGIRSCSQVGVNDMCMSGDIFPTQDVCMNPNLRV
jgi:hypothetical protein